MFRQCSALFDRACADSAITAWVLACDLVAMQALDYASRNNIPVPKKLSVIGFNDTPEALKFRLTSYNFNLNAVALAMTDFIVRRKVFPVMRNRTIIDIDGTIVERETTSSPFKARADSRGGGMQV